MFSGKETKNETKRYAYTYKKGTLNKSILSPLLKIKLLEHPY